MRTRIHPLSRAIYDVRPDGLLDVTKDAPRASSTPRAVGSPASAPPRRPPAVRLAGRAASRLPACRATQDFPTPTEG